MKLFFKIPNKFFSKTQKILKKYTDFKFNFKNFINDIPLHKSNINNRQSDADADLVARLYIDYMKKLDDINLMRRQLNKKKQMMTDMSKKGLDIKELVKDSKKHNDDILKFSEELAYIENEMMTEALKIPNSTHPDSPVGGEEKSKIIKTVGKKRK
jgi:seryl-tRNA synthetase